MPRERVNDYTTDGWHAEVSWRRAPTDVATEGDAPGHVQLATVNLFSPFEFPDVETNGHFEAGERFDGWRVTLDEAALTRLIKVLHKAKRQAFPGAQAIEGVPPSGGHRATVGLGGTRPVEWWRIRCPQCNFDEKAASSAEAAEIQEGHRLNTGGTGGTAGTPARRSGPRYLDLDLEPVCPPTAWSRHGKFCHGASVEVGGKGGPRVQRWWKISCRDCDLSGRFEDLQEARDVVDSHLLATHASGRELCQAPGCRADRVIKGTLRRRRDSNEGLGCADGEVCEHNPDGGNHPVVTE